LFSVPNVIAIKTDNLGAFLASMFASTKITDYLGFFWAHSFKMSRLFTPIAHLGRIITKISAFSHKLFVDFFYLFLFESLDFFFIYRFFICLFRFNEEFLEFFKKICFFSSKRFILA
jgi:hypothetical protein